MGKTIEKITPLAIHGNLSPVRRAAAYARVSSGKEAMLQSLSARVSYPTLPKVERDRIKDKGGFVGGSHKEGRASVNRWNAAPC